MVIREATPADANALSELAVETYSAAFGHSFSPADLTAHLEKHLSPENFGWMLERDTVLVAEAEGHMVGYVQFGRAETEDFSGDAWELRRLYVHADFQNRRVGAQLMNAALTHPLLKNAQHIVLDVWEHNPGAQRFYARYGFEVVGKRAFQVESGAVTGFDLIMVRRRSAPHQAGPLP